MKREVYRSLRDISHEELLSPGGTLCAGCGGLLTLRLFHKVLGKNVVFVNAAGCLTMLAVFPFTPLRSSWIYTAMACAPRVAPAESRGGEGGAGAGDAEGRFSGPPAVAAELRLCPSKRRSSS